MRDRLFAEQVGATAGSYRTSATGLLIWGGYCHPAGACFQYFGHSSTAQQSVRTGGDHDLFGSVVPGGARIL